MLRRGDQQGVKTSSSRAISFPLPVDTFRGVTRIISEVKLDRLTEGVTKFKGSSITRGRTWGFGVIAGVVPSRR